MLYFLIPAYNEESGIEKQIDSIRTFIAPKGLPFRIVIVDDGSTDTTVEKIRARDTRGDLTLLIHGQNAGPARAFQTGFSHVLSAAEDKDVVVTLDADNTHNLRSVQFMLAKIDEGYDVALGSIFATGGMLIGVPFLRHCLTIAASWVYRLCFPITGIRSYTGFYRAVSVAALRRAVAAYGDRLIESAGFVVMAEMLVKFRLIPLFITEVPMIVRYDLKGGASKLKIWRTIKGHLNVIVNNLCAVQPAAESPTPPPPGDR